jgi:hypothetical protein
MLSEAEVVVPGLISVITRTPFFVHLCWKVPAMKQLAEFPPTTSDTVFVEIESPREGLLPVMNAASVGLHVLKAVLIRMRVSTD